MYGGNNTNKCKMWHKFNTCMGGVYEVYADNRKVHNTRGILFNDTRKE